MFSVLFPRILEDKAKVRRLLQQHVEPIRSGGLRAVRHLHYPTTDVARFDVRLGADVLRRHVGALLYALPPGLLRVEEHRTEGRHDTGNGEKNTGYW